MAGWNYSYIYILFGRMIFRNLVLFNSQDLAVPSVVRTFAKNGHSMKLLEFTNLFSDEESCESYLKSSLGSERKSSMLVMAAPEDEGDEVLL